MRRSLMLLKASLGKEPYELVFKIDELNGNFSGADVAVVIGAHDIVNLTAQDLAGIQSAGFQSLPDAGDRGRDPHYNSMCRLLKIAAAAHARFRMETVACRRRRLSAPNGSGGR